MAGGNNSVAARVDDSFVAAIKAGPVAVLVSSTLGYWAYAGVLSLSLSLSL
eukprot:COSAG03_NODE_7600_length_895_cov_3.066583_1_plen_50_part_10